MQIVMKDEKLLRSAKALLDHVGDSLNASISIRLWDGTVVPLGKEADPELFLSLSGPHVLGSLMRRPTLENVVGQYARGDIDFHGADFMSFVERARVKNSRQKARRISKWTITRNLFPFLFAPGQSARAGTHEFQGDATGHKRVQADNKDFIQFHYDVSNDFYKLFLDRNMVYSCAYFTDWNQSLEQAQLDKLDMICRKLRLQPGEKMLDIGCGWGALVCHAAEHYGVEAHGVTLSQAQLDYARQLVRDRNLEGRVHLELQDYMDVQGRFDKIASIGMVEHVGLANMSQYMNKVNSLLPDRGLFLNHGITRTAKRPRRGLIKRVRPERRLIIKYIFPGGELDDIGNSIASMEKGGFRVHDVEGWRDHYALTCKKWCQRLYENREEAIRLIGNEKYRLWLAYLGLVSFPFQDGSMCLFQTVATKHASKGHSTMPPTRRHLYVEKDRSREAA